eukprot:NODE_1591_length_571_cov_566.582375_g1284_i0.p1 GENE.NODE_1591_length_571_cov_566.582375_g1284_i0~~NODE_1591_length_571_cov_566.582375_g1284_i0.p1  ORF type:complete len:147 (-),score=22.15 NODE_1591_length_571_cov_566.582375_g1284_i0:129-548(-)
MGGFSKSDASVVLKAKLPARDADTQAVKSYFRGLKLNGDYSSLVDDRQITGSHFDDLQAMFESLEMDASDMERVSQDFSTVSPSISVEPATPQVPGMGPEFTDFGQDDYVLADELRDSLAVMRTSMVSRSSDQGIPPNT